MGSVIRSLVVKVGADISDFQKQMIAAGKHLEKTGKEWKKTGEAMTKYVTVPILAAGTALVALAVKAGQYAEQISIAAQTTGMSVTKLQELRYVSSQVDVEFETLTGSFAKFTRTLVQAQKPGTEQAKLFETLGVKMKNADGTMRSLNDLYFDSIKALGGMTNETEQAVAASQLFGRSFQELIPLIRTSSEEVERLKKRANELNLVRSPEEIASLAKMDDKIAEIKLRFENAGQTIALKFLPVMDKLVNILETKVFPAIEKITDWVVKMVEKFDGMSDAGKNFTLFSIAIVAAAGPIVAAIGSIIKAMGVLMASAVFKGLTALLGLSGKAATATAAAATAAGGATTAAAATATAAAGATATAAGVLAAAVVVIVGSIAAINDVINKQKNMPTIDPFGRLVKPSMSGAWDVNGKPKQATAPSVNRQGMITSPEKPAYDTSGITDPFANIPKKETQTSKGLTDWNEFGKQQQKIIDNEYATAKIRDENIKKWEKYVASLKSGNESASSSTEKATTSMDSFRESVLSTVNAIKEQTKAFFSLSSIFDVVDTKTVSGDRLFIRLQKRIKAMMDWKNNLALLEKRGVSKEYLNELRGMGPEAGAEIKGLTQLNDTKLKEYFKGISQIQGIAGTEASKFVTTAESIGTKIEKQINIYATGSKGDANTIADAIVKKLRVAGYRI